jgi:Cu2+-exporting ATPase
LREPGQQVLCGSVNQGDPVEICVTALGRQTRWSRLVDLAKRAALERPALLQMADRWAGPFLWGVLGLAAIAGFAWWWIEPARALWVTVSVLVVTCPCALSLAAPAALAAASRSFAGQGALLQRLSALEDLARVDTIVLDKTGTLTQDRLSLAAIVGPQGQAASEHALLQAAGLAAWSRHPAARALVLAAESDLKGRARVQPDRAAWSGVQEKVGLGLEGRDAKGVRWRLGRTQWVRGGPLQTHPAANDASSITLAFGPVGMVVASFELTDTPRPEASSAIAALRTQSVQPWILSGDSAPRVARLAARLRLPVLRAGALPDEKRGAVASLQAAGHVVAMVGDGVNDAPVLAQAQVSLAMGHGSAASIARADVVIHPANLEALPRLIALARRTQVVVRQNLTWALLYNLAAIPIALAGYLPPWAAGLGMTLSSLLVVLNSRRAGHSSLLQPKNLET